MSINKSAPTESLKHKQARTKQTIGLQLPANLQLICRQMRENKKSWNDIQDYLQKEHQIIMSQPTIKKCTEKALTTSQ